MTSILLLRFDAPLMSFGGVAVDAHGVIEEFPAQSMIAGLCGNALGYRHGDFDRLASLQARIQQASRIDVPGHALVDYQTVDLGQPFMREGWTTSGVVERRDGSASARLGTHQRWRHYWAGRIVTVAMVIEPGDGPTTDEVYGALRQPARPLFLGRKCCIPAGPIALGWIQAKSVLDAMEISSPPAACVGPGVCAARWPAELGPRPLARRIRITDERDWANQIHVGRRTVFEGPVTVSPTEQESVPCT